MPRSCPVFCPLLPWLTGTLWSISSRDVTHNHQHNTYHNAQRALPPASSKTTKPSQVTCIDHLLWCLCRPSSPQVSEGKCKPLRGCQQCTSQLSSSQQHSSWWFWWQQCFASPWWRFGSRGLDESNTLEESPQCMGKLSENPELVLPELLPGQLQHEQAPATIWIRALAAGSTAEMTGGSPSLQDALKPPVVSLP